MCVFSKAKEGTRNIFLKAPHGQDLLALKVANQANQFLTNSFQPPLEGGAWATLWHTSSYSEELHLGSNPTLSMLCCCSRGRPVLNKT